MSKTIQLAGFLVRAVIAGLALAFLLIYLWPSLAEEPHRHRTPMQ